MTTRNTSDIDIEPIIKFEATAGVRQYPFGFRVFRASDIQVYLNDVQQASGYSVILTEGIRGGNVLFNQEPTPGTLITILSEVPFVRDSDFNEAGAFRANVVNKEMDIIMSLLRQLRNSFSLSAHLPPYYKGLDLQLPVPAAGKAILWNATGDGFVNSQDNINDLFSDTKAQADIATAKAVIATEQAAIAAAKAVAAAASASSASATVSGFDSHAADKQSAFDANAAAKTKNFNENAKEKQNSVDVSALSAANSAKEAERFRNEAEEIINLPTMAEDIKGAAMVATETEVAFGEIDNKAITPKKLKKALSVHTDNIQNPHQVNAVQIGLGNVDNTSDSDKPVSTATAQMINCKITNCILSAPNGVATYSGNVVTIKAGIKFLTPNGRNADGTLNNINFTLTEDIVSEPFSGPYSLFLFYDYDSRVVGSSDVSMYYESEAEPRKKNNGTIWFNLKENKTYIYRSAWEAVRLVKVAIITVANGVITSLTPFQPVELLKLSDVDFITRAGKPNLELRISKPNTGFTVERDGWIGATLYAVGATNSAQILSDGSLIFLNDAGGILHIQVPVRKGSVITTTKTGSGSVNTLNFIPDMGA